MAFTYNATLATAKDQVRFLSGDTDLSAELLSDEEVTWLTTQYANVYTAASEACRAGAAKLARKIDATVGGMSLQASQRYDHLLALSKELAERSKTVPGSAGWSPVVGGYDPADTNPKHPIFDIGIHDAPVGQNPLTDSLNPT